jgi:hypothetical protein
MIRGVLRVAWLTVCAVAALMLPSRPQSFRLDNADIRPCTPFLFGWLTF